METVNFIMQKLQVMIISLPGTWQKMLQNNLESYPFVKVASVASGSLSALQLLNKRPLDFILIDSSIPSDDVNALVQNVKEENPGIKIIVLTDTAHQHRQILRIGADYAISSCNFEEEIDEILQNMNNSLNVSLT